MRVARYLYITYPSLTSLTLGNEVLPKFCYKLLIPRGRKKVRRSLDLAKMEEFDTEFFNYSNGIDQATDFSQNEGQPSLPYYSSSTCAYHFIHLIPFA